MSISFSCDFCERKYKVDDALAGKKVKCKECETDLLIPDPARAVASPSRAVTTASRPSAGKMAPPPRDLYGLDELEEAPLPPPPRAGMMPEPSRTRRRSSAPDNSEQLRKSGFSLLIFGVGAFILPFLGLQWRLLSFLPIEAQLVLASLMILGGVFCLLASAIGVVKAFLFSLLGGVLGIPALLILLAVLLPALGVVNPAQNPGGPQPQAKGPGGRNGAQPFTPPGAQPPPAFNPPPANPPAEGDLGRVRITGGRVKPSQGLGGRSGVSLEIDFQVESRGFGVAFYDLILTTPNKGRTKVMPPAVLNGSGMHKVFLANFQQSDGPFEVSFEASAMGKTGPVSDNVTLTWVDAPQQGNGQDGAPPGFGPNRGTGPRNPRMPRPPRFGPR